MSKKAFKYLAGALACAWLSSAAYCGVLTHLHGDEFVDPSAIGFADVSTYGWEPNLSVMRCSEEQAVVYYFDDTMGRKVSFVKVDGHWSYEDELATWSSTGSADDYLIWPHWKDCVLWDYTN